MDPVGLYPTVAQGAAGPALAASNITGRPTSTFLGLAVAAQGIGQLVATQGLPTTTAQWVVFSASILAGVFGAFGR